MSKRLHHSIVPWTETDFGQDGFLLTIDNPHTGDRGQGFYCLHDDAVHAYHRALHRFNSGQDPVAYLDAPYVAVP